MNIKIIEKSLLPFFLAIIFLIAFTWQFTYVYAFLINHFTHEKLSILYAHLFIYGFLIFNIFLFMMNTLNGLFIKSKVFIATIVMTLFVFYGFSYQTFLSNLNYFIDYPISINETMFMVLFIVSSLIYGLYTLGILFFNKLVPFSHSIIFLLMAFSYAIWFINTYAYPISEIVTKFEKSKLL